MAFFITAIPVNIPTKPSWQAIGIACLSTEAMESRSDLNYLIVSGQPESTSFSLERKLWQLDLNLLLKVIYLGITWCFYVFTFQHEATENKSKWKAFVGQFKFVLLFLCFIHRCTLLMPWSNITTLIRQKWMIWKFRVWTITLSIGNYQSVSYHRNRHPNC